MNAEIIQFLTELRQNNNREWFQANKSRYDFLRKVFIDEVQQLIGPDRPLRSGNSRIGGERLPVPYLPGYSFFTGQDSV